MTTGVGTEGVVFQSARYRRGDGGGGLKSNVKQL